MKKLAISLVILMNVANQAEGVVSDKLRPDAMCASDPINGPLDKALHACYQKCEDAGRKVIGGWSCLGGPFEDCPSNCYCFCKEKAKTK